MARILVIDDEPAIARIVRLLLEPLGHEVLVANDGSRGFAMAQRQAPDLIVLDLMMPVMDGIWLLGMLRSTDQTVSIPVIVLSARSDDETQRQCESFGIKTYLQKPFQAEEFIAAVENEVVSTTS
jgi:two-component system chemotaxis response regulator CheY